MKRQREENHDADSENPDDEWERMVKLSRRIYEAVVKIKGGKGGHGVVMRADQRAHVETTLMKLRAEPKLVISQAPTGAGKTLMSLQTWKRIKVPVCLVMAPSWDIARHYTEECARLAPGVRTHMHKNTPQKSGSTFARNMIFYQYINH